MSNAMREIEEQATREWEAVVAASRADTYVYRYYDADGRLLYVGSTNGLSSRDAAHKREKPWYPVVARRTTQGPIPRQHALLLEHVAIRDEEPLHNAYAGTGYAGPGSPSWYRRVSELYDALPFEKQMEAKTAVLRGVADRMLHAEREYAAP